LGPHPQVAVDVEGPFPVQVGDTFLLCSDGLSGQVEDHELGAILASLPPEEASSVLVDLANLRGGPDNITVIVARVAGEDLATPPTGEAVASREGPSLRLPVNPAACIVSGVCLFLALVLGLTTSPGFAVVALLASLVSLALGTVLTLRGMKQPAALATTTQRTRQAPYRTQVCKPDEAFVRTLSGVVQELRNAAEEAQWKVNWLQFENHQQAAVQAADVRRHPDAVRHYAKALSFLMNELRNQQASDSNIRY
jgi:protein phosphatase